MHDADNKTHNMHKMYYFNRSRMIENSISDSLFPRFLFHIDSLCLPPHSVSHRYISLLFSPPSHSPRRHILALSPLPILSIPLSCALYLPSLSPLALSPSHSLLTLCPVVLRITSLSRPSLSQSRSYLNSRSLPRSLSPCSPNHIALPIKLLSQSHRSLSPRSLPMDLSPLAFPITSLSPLAISPRSLPSLFLPSLSLP